MLEFLTQVSSCEYCDIFKNTVASYAYLIVTFTCRGFRTISRLLEP